MCKNISRFIAMLTAFFMTAAVSGCKVSPSDAGSNGDLSSVFEIDLPEYVYVPEIVPVPDDIGEIVSHCVVISGGKVLFLTNTHSSDEQTGSHAYFSELYSINIDESSFTKLHNYTPPAPPVSNASGGSNIASICVAGDGNLWIHETWEFGIYDLPVDFDSENDASWNYEYKELESGAMLRKLDATGAELLAVDASEYSNHQKGTYMRSFSIDGAGNVYISVANEMDGSNTIYVLDPNGNKQFQLSESNWVSDLIQLPDGSVAYTVDSMSADGRYARVLQPIDFDAKALSKTIKTPDIGWQIYPGNGEYDILINDNNDLYGFSIGADEPVKLLNWIDSGLLSDGIRSIGIAQDGRIVCISNVYSHIDFVSKTELIILVKTPYSELPEKTMLSLATFGSYSIRSAVVSFNRSNPKYRIQVIDYQAFSTEDDYNAGLMRLNTEIISGKAPDIINLSNLPYLQYVAKGLLADLNPLIDSDPGLSRGDLVEAAFRAAEVDGCLYSVFPSFGVLAFIGHPSVLGEGLSWSFDEFIAVIDAHPDADRPLGEYITKTTFLQAALIFNMGEYIDWEKGTAVFDNASFLQLLEFANTFPAEINYDSNLYREELLASGRQIMEMTSVYNLNETRTMKALLNGDFAFKGFPTENGNGICISTDTNLAITSGSKNVEGAWEFIKTILDKDYQLENNYGGSFPSNRAAFDAQMEQEYENGQHESTAGFGYGDGDGYFEVTLAPITREDVDKVLSLIDSASTAVYIDRDEDLWNIISEGASSYFNGASSAQEAARIIQSRVSILVSERS